MKTMPKIFLFSMLSLMVVFQIDAAEIEHLIRQLESVSRAEAKIYQLKTDQGRRMDCLKVFQPIGTHYHGKYYGIYHRLERGVFGVYLAQSTDLRIWKDVVLLDKHASQPTMYPCNDGRLLLAYEKDAPNSCWIRLRSYDHLPHLFEAKHSNEYDIPRSLAPTAEGTPSFESVSIGKNGLDDSEIRLRFHYFKNVRVDQLAFGKLVDFKSWESEVSVQINNAFSSKGWDGNLGDRDRFMWGNNFYYLQETQRKRGDWSSWRIHLCDFQGMPLSMLKFRTDNHSESFANPNATWITDKDHQRKLLVTLFLPSEGNPSNEAGTLLYVLPNDDENFQHP